MSWPERREPFLFFIRPLNEPSLKQPSWKTKGYSEKIRIQTQHKITALNSTNMLASADEAASEAGFVRGAVFCLFNELGSAILTSIASAPAIFLFTILERDGGGRGAADTEGGVINCREQKFVAKEEDLSDGGVLLIGDSPWVFSFFGSRGQDLRLRFERY